MPRPLQYSYRGEAKQAPEDFSRQLRRVGRVRGWADIVAREGAAMAWLVMLASYLMAFVVLLPIQGYGWLGLAAIHLVYGPVAWLFYRWTHDLPVFESGRVRRAQRWLEAIAASAPSGTALDVEATLGRVGCQGRGGDCGSAWMYGYLFFSDGHSVETRVTDGRACAAFRGRVNAGAALYTYILDGPGERFDIAHFADCLRGFTSPPEFETRSVEIDELGRLVWEVEHVGASRRALELPLWPISRLRSMIAGLEWTESDDPAEGGALSQASSTEGVAGSNEGSRRFFPLHRRGAPLTELLEVEKSRLSAAIPHPSVMLVSAMMGVNGILGGSLLSGLAFFTSPGVEGNGEAALAASVLQGEGWAFVFVAGALIGAMAAAPTFVRLYRQYRGVGSARELTHVGRIDLSEDCVLLDVAPEAASTTIDFTRPFSVDLTRDGVPDKAGSRDARVKVHLTIRQRPASAREVLVIGVSAEVEANPQVLGLPRFGADYPEMRSEDFTRLWGALRQASAAQGDQHLQLAARHVVRAT